MKLRNKLVCIVAVLIQPLLGTVVSAASIQLLQTFDYPGEGNSTLPQKISDQGVMVGTVIDANGKEQGFFYKPRIGRFSDRPFSDPFDTGNVTRGRGVNNNRHTCGEYKIASNGTFHGYILEHPDFISFDVTDTFDTIPLGINNAGDFVGTIRLTNETRPAFVSLGGVVTTFGVPNAIVTFAYQLNKGNQIIGYYIDANGNNHGFTRDKRGTLAFPIDMPGATGTFLLGNNDSNWGVGRYTDGAGVTHGLYFITPDTMMTYDYPGSTFTSLNGINKDGYVVGYYLDAAGIFHGIWAKVNLTATGQPNPSLPTPTGPSARPSPDMLRALEPSL